MKSRLILLLALVGLFVLSSCSLLNLDNQSLTKGVDGSLIGQATLICDRACSERGQCGTAEQGAMILLNSSAPAAVNHDMAVPAGTIVQINQTEPRNVTQYSDNATFPISYYLVTVPDRGFGWVAGWCVGQ